METCIGSEASPGTTARCLNIIAAQYEEAEPALHPAIETTIPPQAGGPTPDDLAGKVRRRIAKAPDHDRTSAYVRCYAPHPPMARVIPSVPLGLMTTIMSCTPNGPGKHSLKTDRFSMENPSRGRLAGSFPNMLYSISSAHKIAPPYAICRQNYPSTLVTPLSAIFEKSDQIGASPPITYRNSTTVICASHAVIAEDPTLL
jgi:hypothetical protein